MFFQSVGLCVITSVLVIFLKQYRPEYAVVTAVCGGAAVTLMILILFDDIKTALSSLAAVSGIDNTVFSAVFKAMGICYITGFASNVCKDFGQSSLAGKIELAGKITVVILTVPIINIIMEAALEFIG